MALRRNIAGVLSNDVYTFRCADDLCYQNQTGEVFDQFRPGNGSGIFTGVTEYPFDPLADNKPVTTQVNQVQNVLPVGADTPPGTSVTKKLNAGALILAGLGVLLYMGMTKKENKTETLLYLGGIGLLYYRMHLQDKQTAPVPATE